MKRLQPTRRLPRDRPSLSLVLLLGPPVLCAVAASHGLLYNRSGLLDWVLAIAVICPLLLRRRAPVAVFWFCWAVAMATWALGTVSFSEFAVLVALYTVAAHRGLRHSLGAAAALELGVVVVAVRFAPAASVNDSFVILSGLGAAAFFLGTTVRAQRRYLDSIEDRTERPEQERAQQAQLAAAVERTRIAREMHDIVAHGLVVVIALSEAAAATTATDPEGARGKMLQAASTGRQSPAGMRRAPRRPAGRRRWRTGPAAGPRLAQSPGGPDPRYRPRRPADRDRRPRESLSAEAQTTVYRILQESLTNVVKHARNASTVDIVLQCRGDLVGFSVTDDGGTVPWKRRPSTFRQRIDRNAGTGRDVRRRPPGGTHRLRMGRLR
ncbi:sensor histidine kinase [Streptomyces sp. NPDC001100]